MSIVIEIFNHPIRLLLINRLTIKLIVFLLLINLLQQTPQLHRVKLSMLHIFYYSLMKLRVISDCNNHVNIYVTERDISNQILNIWTVYNHHTKTSPHPQTTYVELKFQFHSNNNNNTAMCDNIQFKIEIDSFARWINFI